MNANKGPENEEALNQVLGQWTVAAPLPPRFQEQVWQRIAKADSRPEPAAPAAWSRWLAVVLPRPSFAYAYLAVLLLSGVGVGSWAAQVKSSRMESEMSLRYVQSIDPYHANVARP